MAFWALVLGSVIFFKQKTISLSQTFPGTSWKRFHGGRLFDWGLGPLRFFFGGGLVLWEIGKNGEKKRQNRNLIDFCWRVMHICLFVWFVCLVSLFWERAWPYWALLEGSYMPSCQLRYHRVTWYQAWYIVIWIDSVSFVRKHVLFFLVVMEFTSINTFRLYFNWFFLQRRDMNMNCTNINCSPMDGGRVTEKMRRRIAYPIPSNEPPMLGVIVTLQVTFVCCELGLSGQISPTPSNISTNNLNHHHYHQLFE